MEPLIALLRARGEGAAVDISYEPHSEGAQHLYANLDFRGTGEMDDGEVVALLPRTSRPSAPPLLPQVPSGSPTARW